MPLRIDTSWTDALEKLKPQTIFYCSAERDEAYCQKNPLEALAVNAEVPAALAAASEKYGSRFVYFSTSKVFSGDKGDYTESDPRDPVGHYGASKARGEELLAGRPNTFILRLGTLYGLGPVPARSLLNSLLKSIWAETPLTLIDDEYRSFHSIDWVMEACLKTLEAPSSQAGLYHLPSPPKESHYDFGIKLSTALGIAPDAITPVSGEEFSRHQPPPARRGQDTSLDGKAFEAAFGIQPEVTFHYLKKYSDLLRTGHF